MTATDQDGDVDVDLAGPTGDDVATLVGQRRAALVEQARTSLGDLVAERLARGLGGAEVALRSRSEPIGDPACLDVLDSDAAWAVAIAVRHVDPRTRAVVRFLDAEAIRRMRERRTVPLPTAAARDLQEVGLLDDAQVARLHELFSMSRGGNQAVAAAHRVLVDDCLALVAADRAGTTRRLDDVRAALAEGVVVLDPQLTVAIEREHARTVAGSVTRPRSVLVVVGPTASGKRRFARAAATALGRPLHRVRASGLTTSAAVRGASPFTPEPQRGVFVDAVLRTGCRNPVIHVEGIDRLEPAEAERVAGHLADVVDQPGQALDSRYLPREFSVAAEECLLVVTAQELDRVPAVLRDLGACVELDPPTPAQRREIVERFLLPELSEAALEGDDPDVVGPLVAPGVVDDLLDRHAGEVGVRDLADDLRVLIGAFATSERAGPVDEEWATELLGPAPAAVDRPGSLLVPILVGHDVALARLDVARVPGHAGTLVPDTLEPVSAGLVRDAVDGLRATHWGHALPAGLRVTLNLQAAEEPVVAPWLSAAAVVAAASLAAEVEVPSPVVALAVVTGPGPLESIDRGVVDPVRLAAAVGPTALVLAPSAVDGAAATIVTDIDALLAACGLRPGPGDDVGAVYL